MVRAGCRLRIRGKYRSLIDPSQIGVEANGCLGGSAQKLPFPYFMR